MQVRPCDRVPQEHLMRMKGKALRQLGELMAIQKITGNGAAQMRHVYAYLMGSPRFQFKPDK